MAASEGAGGPLRAGDRPVGRPFATRSPVLARSGMVCASQPLAARLGVDVLREGGTAVDAAIATNAALCLMEPTGCGLGGDLFAIVWHHGRRELIGLNGSGRSPRSLGLATLRDLLTRRGCDEIPLDDALSISVPGCVDGWCTLHARFGRLPLARLLEPTIAAARDGFPVTQVIAAAWARSTARHGGRSPFAAVFLPGGRAPREGEIFRNPALADVLEGLASGGRDAFYTGGVAAAIAACVQAGGGFLSPEDLAGHRSEWVSPVSVTFRGHEVWELPPNGQGLAALQMLALLEGWPPRPPDALAWHRAIEAKKLAYEDRARHYADPRASPSAGWLLSPRYTVARRALVDDDRAARRVTAGAPPEAGDTVCLSAADAEGNVVSWIQSNYTGFGSGLVPEGLGFSLQNRGHLFHLDAAHANAYAPGKRPFHTIIPAMVTRHGLPVLSFGVMGGAMQPQGHVQVLVNMLDHGLNVQEAGDAPRWRHDGSSRPTGGPEMDDGGEVHAESGVPDEIVDGLRARGHRVTVQGGGYGGYQAIAIDDVAGDRVYRGASESRKDGAAVGW